jgi:hypothetical protein
MTPEQIASLPVQVLFAVAIITLFKALMDAQNARVADLKQIYAKNVSDLNNRVMMIEDRLSIKPPLMDDAILPGAKLN